MRVLLSLLSAVLLLACGTPADNSKEDDSANPGQSYRLMLPAQYATTQEPTLYATLMGNAATALTELVYGLSAGYPTLVSVTPKGGYLRGQQCSTQEGAVIWNSIVAQDGTAAKVSLDHGKLLVTLVDEGTVTLLLDGQIEGQDCKLGDSGASVATLPLQHKVVLRIHRAVGYVVEQFNQRLFGCTNSLVLLSNVGFRFPTAQPVNAAGQHFDPANAPTPVSITLHSSGALSLDSASLQVSAAAGQAVVHVDTDLPVDGLHSFDVVGLDSLTAVHATLYLNKATNKGRYLELIKEEVPLRIFMPEKLNTVDVRCDAASTTLGTLCAQVPGSAFAASSSTPEYCSAPGSWVDSLGSSFPIATIKAIGECELAVTLPGTSFLRPIKFRTSL